MNKAAANASEKVDSIVSSTESDVNNAQTSKDTADSNYNNAVEEAGKADSDVANTEGLYKDSQSAKIGRAHV